VQNEFLCFTAYYRNSMSRGRVAFPVLGMAALASQAGHLLAYQLRFGAAAQQLQSSGAHAYFPTLLKTLLGGAALALLAALLLVGFARLATGRRIEKHSAPSLLRLLAALYTMQLAFFAVQETLEGSPASQIFLWGLLGQLPVALLGAVTLRWLLSTLVPALAGLARRVEPALQLVTITTTSPTPWPAPALVGSKPVAGPISRRGPPSF
jgi:hypothetical protein